MSENQFLNVFFNVAAVRHGDLANENNRKRNMMVVRRQTFFSFWTEYTGIAYRELVEYD